MVSATSGFGIDRIAAGDGRVADADPGHVRDRIQGTGGEHADDDAELPGARPRGLGEQRPGDGGQNEERAELHFDSPEASI